jgi:hypothetical protein
MLRRRSFGKSELGYNSLVLDGDAFCYDSGMRCHVERSIGEVLEVCMKITDIDEHQHWFNRSECFANVIGVMCFLITSTERRHVGVWERVEALYLSRCA